MRNPPVRWKAALAVAAGVLMSTAALAAHLNQHQRVNDMDVYYGVVPSSIVEAHPAGHAEATMHGGPAPGSYHLVVSLVDSRSGRPITDARVSAMVASRFFSRGEERPLEPMKINNTVSYGNYFALSRPGTYQIHVFIQRPEVGHVETATFSYRQP